MARRKKKEEEAVEQDDGQEPEPAAEPERSDSEHETPPPGPPRVLERPILSRDQMSTALDLAYEYFRERNDPHVRDTACLHINYLRAHLDD